MRRISPYRVFKVSAISVALVLAADYAGFAATGQSVILGRVNYADRATTIVRTTPGAPLNLSARSGSAPLAVNSSTLVTRLNADKLDGLHASSLARPARVSSVETPGCESLATGTNTFQKVTDLGTFTKARSNTLVRLDISNHYLVQSGSGSTGTVYQLRVDNATSTVGTTGFIISSGDYGKDVTAPLFGTFKGLAAGTHTASLWAMTPYGTVSGVYLDPGCWNAWGTNRMVVTEF